VLHRLFVFGVSVMARTAARLADMRNFEKDPRAPRLEVEDAMASAQELTRILANGAASSPPETSFGRNCLGVQY